MGNCCYRRRTNIGPISILLLGCENTGKTEIGHLLAHKQRIDYTSTKGVRLFDVHVKDYLVKLNEIGGSDSVRNIWPHYYTETFGIIFVIDCSPNAPFDLMRDILHHMMSHKNIRGKPLLIIANKQDVENAIDVVDITYYFHIDEMCNLFSTPCYIITSGASSHDELSDGMEWLVKHIVDHYNELKNRIRFNRLFTSPMRRLSRQRTSIPTQQRIKRTKNRVKSAPSTVTAATMAKMNGTAKLKPIENSSNNNKNSNLFNLNTIVVGHE